MALYFGDKKVQINSGTPVNGNNESYVDVLVETTITEFKSRTIRTVGQYGLAYQHYLKKIDLESVEIIEKSAFMNDYVLDTLIIRTPKVCELPNNLTMHQNNGYIFWNTPIENGTGFIYVPDDLVNKYKSHTNWCLFSDQIKPISELGE